MNSSTIEQVAVYNAETRDEHDTQISGSGWITTTDTRSRSFFLHICQHLTGTQPTDDIIVQCLLTGDLPPPGKYVHFSGELLSCQKLFFADNTISTCVIIFLD